MLAQCGAPDVLIAYPIVGPNVGRVRALVEKYPTTQFSVLCDHPDGAEPGSPPGGTGCRSRST